VEPPNLRPFLVKWIKKFNVLSFRKETFPRMGPPQSLGFKLKNGGWKLENPKVFLNTQKAGSHPKESQIFPRGPPTGKLSKVKSQKWGTNLLGLVKNFLAPEPVNGTRAPNQPSLAVPKGQTKGNGKVPLFCLVANNFPKGIGNLRVPFNLGPMLNL